jgi:hypothetical protein
MLKKLRASQPVAPVKSNNVAPQVVSKPVVQPVESKQPELVVPKQAVNNEEMRKKELEAKAAALKMVHQKKSEEKKSEEKKSEEKKSEEKKAPVKAAGKGVKKGGVKGLKPAKKVQAKSFKALNPANDGNPEAQITDLSNQIDGLRNDVNGLLTSVAELDGPAGQVDQIVNDINTLESDLTNYGNKVKSINPDNVNIMDNLLLKRIDVATDVIVPKRIPADSTIYYLNDVKLVDPANHLHWVKMLDYVPRYAIQLNPNNTTNCYDRSKSVTINGDVYVPLKNMNLTTNDTVRYDVAASEFDRTKYESIVNLTVKTLIDLTDIVNNIPTSRMVNTMHSALPTIRIHSDLVSADEYKAGNQTYHYEYDAKTNLNTLRDASDNIVTLNDLRELVTASLSDSENYVLLFNNLVVKMIKATVSYETQVTFDARPKAVLLKENNMYLFTTLDEELVIIKATSAANISAPNRYASIQVVGFNNSDNNKNFMVTTASEVYYINNDNSVHKDIYSVEETGNYYNHNSKIQTINSTSHKLVDVSEETLFSDADLIIYNRYNQPLVNKFFILTHTKLFHTDANGALTLDNLETGLLTLPDNFNIVYQIVVTSPTPSLDGITLNVPYMAGVYNIKINGSTVYNPSTDSLNPGDVLTVYDTGVDLPATNLAGIWLVNTNDPAFAENIWFVNEDATLSAPDESFHAIIDDKYLRDINVGNTMLQDYIGAAAVNDTDYYMVITQETNDTPDGSTVEILRALHIQVSNHVSEIISLDSSVLGNYLLDLSNNSLYLLDGTGSILTGSNVPEDSLVVGGTDVLIQTRESDDSYMVFRVSNPNQNRVGKLELQAFNEGELIYLLTVDDTITLNAAIAESCFDLTLNTTTDHHEHYGIPNEDPVDENTPRILIFVGSASRTSLNKNEMHDYWALEYANVFGEDDQIFIDDSTSALYKISNGDENIDAGTIVHYDNGVWEVSNYATNSALSDLGLNLATGNDSTIDKSMLFIVDSNSDLTSNTHDATTVNGETKYNYAVANVYLELTYHSSNPYYAAAPDHKNNFSTDSYGVLDLVPDIGVPGYVVRPDNRLGWFDGSTGFYDSNSVSTTDPRVREKNYINYDVKLAKSSTNSGDMSALLDDLMWVKFDPLHNYVDSDISTKLFFAGVKNVPDEATIIYVRYDPDGPAYNASPSAAAAENGLKLLTKIVNPDESLTPQWRSILLLASPDVI